ncbi:MAG: hypothetical protein ABIJ96_10285 [Elusimicrobiota bacterium]
MKLDKRQVAMWLSLGAVLGALIVGVLGRCHFQRHKRYRDPEHVVRKISSGLDLAPEQQLEIKKIIIKKQEDFNSLRDEAKAKRKVLREDMRDHIRKVLTPEQAAKFNERVAKWDKPHKRRN